MTGEWWLVEKKGVRRRIDAGGVLVGRSPACDLILGSPKASRSQALIYLDDRAPRLVVLGKGAILVNGTRAERDERLADGDHVDLPGKELVVARDGASGWATERACWVLSQPDGTYFGVSQTPFVVGGRGGVDLQVEGWPAHALTLHMTEGRLHVTAETPLHIDEVPVAVGCVVDLAPGSRIRHGSETLQVIAQSSANLGVTLVTTGGGAPDTQEPERVELEFLPRGGRLSVRAGGDERRAYLPGNRCDLLALLLQPPEPHARGELLEDDVVLARVWPNQSRTRVDLNTLIYRLRRDLERAGIDAGALIVRAPGGGGTTLGLSPHVAIQVR